MMAGKKKGKAGKKKGNSALGAARSAGLAATAGSVGAIVAGSVLSQSGGKSEAWSVCGQNHRQTRKKGQTRQTAQQSQP
jgi:hypothetical protein